MRYKAEETAQRHDRIVEAASQLFRKHGFGGVSVAEIMEASGLTHGAFYAHFESKDALAVAAIEQALDEMLGHVCSAGDAPDPQTVFTSQYLSLTHRDDAGHGCAMAALASEIGRKGGSVQEAFTGRCKAIVDRVTETFYREKGRAARAEAIFALSALLGAIVLARAAGDPELSAEILDASRSHFGLEPTSPQS